MLPSSRVTITTRIMRAFVCVLKCNLCITCYELICLVGVRVCILLCVSHTKPTHGPEFPT